MDWLTDNPVANMVGPEFLVLYGLVIGATLPFCWWAVHCRDKTAQLPPLPVADDPDPYEVAYLRGGENELTRLVIFDLIQHDYLEVIEEEKKWWRNKTESQLAQVPNRARSDQLSPIQREVYNGFTVPRKASEIFTVAAIPNRIQRYCHLYEQRLENQQLRNSPTVAKAAWGCCKYHTT